MVAIARKENTEKVPYVRKVNDVIVESGIGGGHANQPGCECYENKAQLHAANAEIQDLDALIDLNQQIADIDENSGVNIDKTHLAKAHEAELVKFQGITTPPERFPHLYPESQSKGMTMEALADIVWEKHSEEALRENDRMVAKSAV